MSTNDQGFKIALEEAQDSFDEGGIPVGSAIISKGGEVLGRGRNTRIQNGSPVMHGETAAFDSNCSLPTSGWEGSTIYTTLSPCPMCAGAMIWFKVARVVIGDAVNMSGREELLRSHGIEVVVLNDQGCQDLLQRYKEEYPERWSNV